MPTQIQYAQQIAAMTESFMQGKTAEGGNYFLIRKIKEMFGWPIIDSGHFSLVMDHPADKDLVVKVVLGAQGWDKPHGIRRATHLVDGYLDFVATVMRGPRSKFLPEFHAAVVREKCAVVIMRRYVPSRNAPAWVDREPMYFMRDGFGKMRDAGLYNVVQCMGYANDLHPDNYMYDESNQCFVITDPYSRNKGTTDTHVERWVGKDGVVNVDVQFAPEPLPITYGDIRVHELKMPQLVVPKGVWDIAEMENAFLRPINHFARRNAPKIQDQFMGRRADNIILDELQDLPAPAEEIQNVRTDLATGGKKPTLRQKEKDTVLRIKSKYDCGARIKGLPRTLLQRQRAWWVRGTWHTVIGRLGRSPNRSREHSDKPVDGAA